MRKIIPETDDYSIGTAHGLKKEKSKPRYPTIRIDHKHFPEAKGSAPGDEHHVEMKLKMVGNNQSRYDNSGEYEIHEMGAKKKAKKSTDLQTDEQQAEEET